MQSVEINLPEAQAPRLETNRLALRQMHESDTNAFFKLMSDSAVVSQTSWPLCQSLEQARKLMNDMNAKLTARNSIYWGIADRKNDQLIGYVALTNFIPSELRSGSTFALLQNHWGQGLCTEALQAAVQYGFDHIKLNRIQAFVFTDNAASEKVLTKVGFKYEGLLRDYFHDSRGFHDLKLLAILRRDPRAH